MPSAAEVIVRVEQLGRSFDVFPSEQTRARHAMWDLAAGLPGPAGRVAARRRDRLGHRVWALRHVSFAVARGETVGIIGMNGSGKSTLLHVLCGTLTASEGSAHVAGRIGALLELGTGFVPDQTGRENVLLSGQLHGLSYREVTRRLDAIEAFADIGAYIDQPVRTYSSGMYVRLAFAVMAHIDADLLIIDEALAVGDIFFVHRCLGHLEAFRESGGTLLFVSHDIAAVQRLCGRVLWLDRGVLRGEGGPREMTERYLEGLIGRHVETPAVQHNQPSRRASEGRAVADHRQPEAIGAGGASITGVVLMDQSGRPLHAVVGGERVTIQVTVHAHAKVTTPIVGFYVKDRLGQHLFGENTLIVTERAAAAVGDTVTATFGFVMPRLSPGDYVVAVAVAEGTQAHHVQHHWMHDAWHFVSHWPGDATGLVGIEVTASLDVHRSS